MRIIPITPLFLLIFAMFIFGWSITQYGGISQYGAGFMPCIISGLLLFLAAIDVAIDIKHRHRNKVSLTFDEVKALLLVITVVLLFVLLLDILGFVICSFFVAFYFNENTRCQTFAFRYRFDIGISYYLVHFCQSVVGRLS
ncbi:tripartite tricarboxylate transporter TctB family protein [Escherichia coli]|nr:tripartite tricarboxylate transporter TctB family protein [Escherichia coli]